MKMIEKVARAIATVRYGAEGFREEDDGVHYWGVHYWELCENEARAALEALREPTPEMLAATLPIIGMHCDPATTRLAERALCLLEPKDFPVESHRSGLDAARTLIGDHRAMIDAALSE